jgi:hypothetical protein
LDFSLFLFGVVEGAAQVFTEASVRESNSGCGQDFKSIPPAEPGA